MLLTIDLAALCRNYQTIKNQFTGLETAAVVKANAYGLGVAKIAATLTQEGCRHFFVATVAEGVNLRKILPDRATRVSVLNGYMGEDVALFEQMSLTPVINQLPDLMSLLTWQQNQQKQQDAILHIDTGMNRLGLSLGDLAVIEAQKLFRNFTPLYVMSHLACADEINHPLNAQQLHKAQHILTKIPSKNGISLCNSAGIYLDDTYHFDLARPGIALYGGAINADVQNLSTVVTLTAKIIQKRIIRKGESIGYGANYIADRDHEIAIIACGYADGLHRLLGGQGHVDIQGKKCPLIGRISMDLSAIDISPMTEEVSIGAEVEIFGPNANITTLAKQGQTIDYELLTSLGQREQRCYLDR